jgi:hypothetical protein
MLSGSAGGGVDCDAPTAGEFACPIKKPLANPPRRFGER